MSSERSSSAHPEHALPAQPSLEHLRNESKQRLKALRAQEPRARLADAQLAVARDYGFASWRALKAHVDSVTRRRVFAAFESAEREADSGRKRHALTFVIVGAGPTGVELAGAVAEIARHSLKREYRRIRPADARIVLVEAGNRVPAGAEPDSSLQAWFISLSACRTSLETPCPTSRAASSNCVFIFLSSSSSMERFTSALTSAT